MDFIRLTLPGESNYRSGIKIIGGWSTLIWHEKWQAPSEFELHTPKILETLGLLPEKSLVSIRQSRRVMEVENRTVEVDDDGNRFLKVTGREVTKILDQRHVESKYGKKRQMRRTYTATGAVLTLVWNAIDNITEKDVTRGDPGNEDVNKDDYFYTTRDALPNVSVTDSVVGLGEQKRWWLKEGPLGPQVLGILRRGDIDIRTIRPESGPCTKVNILWGLANRGDINRVAVDNTTTLRFDVYNGVDRSHQQSTRKIVGFKFRQGHIENANYLFSVQDYVTGVEIMSSVGFGDRYRNSTEAGFTGWDRRITSFDAGEPDIPDEPEKPDELKKNATKQQREDRAEAMDKWIDKHAAWKAKRDRIMADFRDDSLEDADRILKQHRRVSLFSGDISPLAPYKYGVDYNLGDTVTLYGEFDETQAMVVTEYVRTHDAEGDSGQPGLSMP